MIFVNGLARNKTMKELNKLALTEIEKHNFKLAKKILEYNARKNPSVQTLNNLGVFYSSVGKYSWALKRFCIDEKLAIHYLKKACKYSSSFYSLSELGLLSLNHNRYEEAYSFFTETLTLKQNSFVENNLGVCNYYLKKYRDASNCFNTAYSENNSDKRDLIYESLGIALAKCGEFEKARKVLYDLLNNSNNYEISPNTLTLAYICHDFNVVFENYENVFKVYNLSIDDYKIIINSLKEIQQYGKLKGFQQEVNRWLIDVEYISEDEKQQFKKISLESIGYQIDILYHPLILSQCNYFGCSLHNNDF